MSFLMSAQVVNVALGRVYAKLFTEAEKFNELRILASRPCWRCVIGRVLQDVNRPLVSRYGWKGT